MGRQFNAKCNSCGKIFEVKEGGGRDFYLLHCTVTGLEKIITTNELMKAFPDLDPLLTLNQKIEELAGKSKYGQFKLDAKARCPYCYSDIYEYADEENVEIVFYD